MRQGCQRPSQPGQTHLCASQLPAIITDLIPSETSDQPPYLQHSQQPRVRGRGAAAHQAVRVVGDQQEALVGRRLVQALGQGGGPRGGLVGSQVGWYP